MKLTIISIICLFALNHAFGVSITTVDYIAYNGCTYQLAENDVMEHYFNAYPDKYPNSDLVFIHTNKNYTAHFVIIENKFYLTGLYVQRQPNNDSAKSVNVIKEIFSNDTVALDWYSGNLMLSDNYFDTCSELKSKLPYVQISIRSGAIINVAFKSEKGMKRLKSQLFRKYKRSNDYKVVFEHYHYLNNPKPFIKSRILFLSAQCNLPERKKIPTIIY